LNITTPRIYHGFSPMPDFLSIREIASLFGLPEDAVRHIMNKRSSSVRPDFYSIRQLADRWSCSRGTVYNVLRSTGTSVVDFAAKGRKGHKLVPIAAVEEIERRKLRRLS
jgi:predicted DNA-binding protein YlxM (UPF0122 family)